MPRFFRRKALKPSAPKLTSAGRRTTHAAGILAGRKFKRDVKHAASAGRITEAKGLNAMAGVIAHGTSKPVAFRSGFRRGYTGRAHRGRNQGSFKGRAGQWKKGQGGRFVGSG